MGGCDYNPQCLRLTVTQPEVPTATCSIIERFGIFNVNLLRLNPPSQAGTFKLNLNLNSEPSP